MGDFSSPYHHVSCPEAYSRSSVCGSERNGACGHRGVGKLLTCEALGDMAHEASAGSGVMLSMLSFFIRVLQTPAKFNSPILS